MNRELDGKKTLISIICNIITVIISILVSLITTIFLTRVISLADLGIATSFITMKNIFNIFCLLSIYISINRMLLDIKENDFEYLSSIYIFSSVFCLFTYFIYLIFSKYFNYFLGFDTKLMSLMFLMIFLINSCTIMVTYWNFKNNYKWTFIYNILSNPVSQVCSLVFALLLTDKKYLGRIVGIDTFNIIFGIICTFMICFKGKFNYNKDYVKKSLKICIPMIPHLLAQLLLSSCDLLMIKNLTGAANAGIYSMAYTISNLLYAMLVQLFNPWSPWVYRRLKNNEIDTIKSNSKLLISLSFVFCVGLICISPELIKIFLTKDYYPAINLVVPICIGVFFQIMYIFFYDIEYFYKKNFQIAVYSVMTAILNIILNFVFIKKFGYSAAAYTTLVSYFLLFMLHYYGMKKVEKRKIYDLKYIALVSFFLLLFSVLLNISNYNCWIRYLIFGVICGCMILKYKSKIYDIIYRMRCKNDK